MTNIQCTNSKNQIIEKKIFQFQFQYQPRLLKKQFYTWQDQQITMKIYLQ
jgi:hypothetical protein